MEAQLQQQQLAMLQLMQEAGGFPPASLLSHSSAQGSSNLIYILKSLQVRTSQGLSAVQPFAPHPLSRPSGGSCRDLRDFQLRWPALRDCFPRLCRS